MANENLERFQQIQNDRFEALHSRELQEITKNYSTDEQVDICKVVESGIMLQELARREEKLDIMLGEILKVMQKAFDMSSVFARNLDLAQKEKLISELRKVVRVSEKTDGNHL